MMVICNPSSLVMVVGKLSRSLGDKCLCLWDIHSLRSAAFQGDRQTHRSSAITPQAPLDTTTLAATVHLSPLAPWGGAVQDGLRACLCILEQTDTFSVLTPMAGNQGPEAVEEPGFMACRCHSSS